MRMGGDGLLFFPIIMGLMNLPEMIFGRIIREGPIQISPQADHCPELDILPLHLTRHCICCDGALYPNKHSKYICLNSKPYKLVTGKAKNCTRSRDLFRRWGNHPPHLRCYDGKLYKRTVKVPCPPGYQPKTMTPHEANLLTQSCEKCPADFFSDRYGLHKCHECQKCENYVKECNSTSNSVCSPSTQQRSVIEGPRYRAGLIRQRPRTNNTGSISGKQQSRGEPAQTMRQKERRTLVNADDRKVVDDDLHAAADKGDESAFPHRSRTGDRVDIHEDRHCAPIPNISLSRLNKRYVCCAGVLYPRKYRQHRYICVRSQPYRTEIGRLIQCEVGVRHERKYSCCGKWRYKSSHLKCFHGILYKKATQVPCNPGFQPATSQETVQLSQGCEQCPSGFFSDKYEFHKCRECLKCGDYLKACESTSNSVCRTSQIVNGMTGDQSGANTSPQLKVTEIEVEGQSAIKSLKKKKKKKRIKQQVVVLTGEKSKTGGRSWVTSDHLRASIDMPLTTSSTPPMELSTYERQIRQTTPALVYLIRGKNPSGTLIPSGTLNSTENEIDLEEEEIRTPPEASHVVLYTLSSAAGVFALALGVIRASVKLVRFKKSQRIPRGTYPPESSASTTHSVPDSNNIDVPDFPSSHLNNANGPETIPKCLNSIRTRTVERHLDLDTLISFHTDESVFLATPVSVEKGQSGDPNMSFLSWSHFITEELKKGTFYSDINETHHLSKDNATQTSLKPVKRRNILGGDWDRGGRFDCQGGCVEKCESDVKLIVPEKAVGQGMTATVAGKVFTNVNDFVEMFDLTEEEQFVSPVVEFVESSSMQFKTHLTVQIPIASSVDLDLGMFRVLCVPGNGDLTVREVPKYAPNISQDMAYVSKNDGFVHIYTKHFTLFACTICAGRQLRLDGLVFGRCQPSGKLTMEAEVRLYICDTLHLIKDFKTALEGEEKRWGRQLLDGKTIRLDEPASAEDQLRFSMELAANSPWNHDKRRDGSLVFPDLDMKLSEVVLCHIQTEFPPVAAEWKLSSVGNIHSFDGLIDIDHRPSSTVDRQLRTTISVKMKCTDNTTKSIPWEDDKLSEYLANNLANNEARRLGRKLGLSDAELDVIYSDNQSAGKLETHYQVIRKCESKLGAAVFRERICCSLEEIDRKDISEELKLKKVSFEKVVGREEPAAVIISRETVV